METKVVYYSDLPVPPGEYLEEVLGELGMSKDELARRMNRPAPKLSAIFKGEKAITPDTALQLEKVVGVPAHIWTGLEAEYRLTLAREQGRAEEDRLKKEGRLVKRFRYADLVKRGMVARKTQPMEKAFELQKFFGVTSLENILQVRRYQAAFRTGSPGNHKQSPEAVAAWLRVGELQAQKQECSPFQERKLKKVLPRIRSLAAQNPEQFMEGLHSRLAGAGIALVLCPHLPRTYANGATFWMGRDKGVVMMTIRGKWSDIFWFSLFHELGHISLHSRQAIFLEGEGGDPALQAQEKEADRFAEDALIPRDKYDDFVNKNRFYPEDMKKFAGRVGVPAGIIVGRLQNDGYLERSWHNNLRSRFEWKE